MKSLKNKQNISHKYFLISSIAGNIVQLVPAAIYSIQVQLLYLNTKNTDNTLKLLHFV
jgi:hypothetical protein